MELSWLPPPPQTWNGIILNYTVTYQNLGPVNSNSSADKLTTSLTEALPSAGQPLSNSPDPWFAVLPLQPESLVIGDLEEFHVYSFSVHMANSAGRSASSNMIIQELPGAGTYAANLPDHSSADGWVSEVVSGAHSVYSFVTICSPAYRTSPHAIF